MISTTCTSAAMMRMKSRICRNSNSYFAAELEVEQYLRTAAVQNDRWSMTKHRSDCPGGRYSLGNAEKRANPEKTGEKKISIPAPPDGEFQIFMAIVLWCRGKSHLSRRMKTACLTMLSPTIFPFPPQDQYRTITSLKKSNVLSSLWARRRGFIRRARGTRKSNGLSSNPSVFRRTARARKRLASV